MLQLGIRFYTCCRLLNSLIETKNVILINYRCNSFSNRSSKTLLTIFTFVLKVNAVCQIEKLKLKRHNATFRNHRVEILKFRKTSFKNSMWDTFSGLWHKQLLSVNSQQLEIVVLKILTCLLACNVILYWWLK